MAGGGPHRAQATAPGPPSAVHGPSHGAWVPISSVKAHVASARLRNAATHVYKLTTPAPAALPPVSVCVAPLRAPRRLPMAPIVDPDRAQQPQAGPKQASRSTERRELVRCDYPSMAATRPTPRRCNGLSALTLSRFGAVRRGRFQLWDVVPLARERASSRAYASSIAAVAHSHANPNRKSPRVNAHRLSPSPLCHPPFRPPPNLSRR